MPVKFSEEFKRDAVALVLTQGMSQKQVCADMGISKSALQAWVRNVELAGRGIAPAASAIGTGSVSRRRCSSGSASWRWRTRSSGRRGVSFASEPSDRCCVHKIVFPLVRELAAAGAPVRVSVAVAYRVLGFSKQGRTTSGWPIRSAIAAGTRRI